MKLKNQFGQGSGFEGQDFRQQQYGANPYPAQQMGYSVPPQMQGQMQGQMQQGFSPLPSTGSSQGGRARRAAGSRIKFLLDRFISRMSLVSCQSSSPILKIFYD